MNKKVSDYLAEFLKAQNIKHVFGIVGAGNVGHCDLTCKCTCVCQECGT